MIQTVPADTNLGWVQYQLANDLGIERSQYDIWWAIYNDAGRNHSIATEMLEEIANNRIALSEFAQTLVRPQRDLVFVESPRSLNAIAIITGVIGIIVGLLFGAIL